jgi:hypothetical protein
MRLKDGDTGYFRFVSPKTYTLGVHGGVETKPKPKDVKGDNWPKMMWGVCRLDKAFRVRDAAGQVTEAYEDGYGSCYIHESQRGKKDKFDRDASAPRVQTFGLAVQREPVLDDSTGMPTSFRDVTEEFKDSEGTTHVIPRLLMVQQAFSNFWAPLKASMFMGPASICGWDFKVSRKENDYVFGAFGTPDFQPGEPAWKLYDQTIELLGFNLLGQLLEWASADWEARWFDPSKTPEGGYGRQGDDDAETADSKPDAAPVAGQPSDEEVADFGAELRAGRK